MSLPQLRSLSAFPVGFSFASLASWGCIATFVGCWLYGGYLHATLNGDYVGYAMLLPFMGFAVSGIALPIVWTIRFAIWGGWQVRAARNASVLGVVEPRYGPEATFLWCVPLVGLVLPFSALRELFVTSRPRAQVESSASGGGLLAWWMGARCVAFVAVPTAIVVAVTVLQRGDGQMAPLFSSRPLWALLSVWLLATTVEHLCALRTMFRVGQLQRESAAILREEGALG